MDGVVREGKIGDKVLVPRTGGSTTLGTIIEMYYDSATVRFQLGDTYRGRHVSKKLQDSWVFKTVKLSELQVIEEGNKPCQSRSISWKSRM